MDEMMVVSQPQNYRDDDGLLVCGKCGERLEMRLPLILDMKEPMVVPIKCECQLAEEREEEKARLSKERAARIAKERVRCFKGAERYRSWVFERDDRRNPEITEACQRFAAAFDAADPCGLLLWGGTGTGKSVMAACLANAVIDKGLTARFTDIGYIVSLMESSFEGRRSNLDELLQYDLLLIDDLGVQRSTEYMMEHVYGIVDGRYRSNKPMVITTNFTLDQIASSAPGKQWQRVFDRIMEVCYPIGFKGASRRKRNAADMRKTMRERLGI